MIDNFNKSISKLLANDIIDVALYLFEHKFKPVTYDDISYSTGLLRNRIAGLVKRLRDQHGYVVAVNGNHYTLTDITMKPAKSYVDRVKRKDINFARRREIKKIAEAIKGTTASKVNSVFC